MTYGVKPRPFSKFLIKPKAPYAVKRKICGSRRHCRSASVASNPRRSKLFILLPGWSECFRAGIEIAAFHFKV